MFRIHMLPARDGDCLIVETGNPADPHRILIDGGRRDTLDAILARIGGWMPRATPVDLMVLTHVDADHVEGLLAYLVTASSPAVGGIWLNGLNQELKDDHKSSFIMVNCLKT